MAFVARLSADGIRDNPWWYSSGNPFYTAGYGLPNCTCYAYGRYAEIRGAFAPLPTGDAGTWYGRATNFQRGQTPRLGAVVCYGRTDGGAGHVAIVEIINADGSIVTSNSAWQGTFFWRDTARKEDNYIPSGLGSSYYFQGFIYNDGVENGGLILPNAEWKAKRTYGYARESDEALNNAIMTFSQLYGYGWTLNAICGLLGNVEIESGYNPWRWESEVIYSSTDSRIDTASHGYGLTQFTPSGKYLHDSRAQAMSGYAPNYSDKQGNPNDGKAQLEFLDKYADYYPTSGYDLSYEEYKASDSSIPYLVRAWCYNYERPADPLSSIGTRAEAGLYWYGILSQYQVGLLNKKRKMPVYMMIRRLI